MLNPMYKGSHFFWDENFMLRYDPFFSEDKGMGDSVGNTAYAYLLYPHQGWIKESVLSCIKQRDDTYIQFYRYPEFGANTVSRDHVAMIITAFYVNRDWDDLEFILENMPWRLSRKYTQTIDFWLWQKSILHIIRNSWKRHVYINLFYLLNIVIFLIQVPLNGIVRKLLGIKTIEVGETQKSNLGTGFKRYVSKIIYPDFALFQLVWQVRVLPSNIFKKILQFILVFDVPSYNFVVKYLLTGKKISEEQRNSFKPHSSSWSRRIDTQIDFPTRFLPEDQYRYNDLNIATLEYCYREIDKIMLDLNPINVALIKNNQNLIQY